MCVSDEKAERRDTTEAFCSSVLIIFPAYYKNFSIAENSKVSLDLMLVKMSFIPIYYTLVLCIAAKHNLLLLPFLSPLLIYCFALLLPERSSKANDSPLSCDCLSPPAPLRFQLQNEKSTRESRHSSQLAGIVL